MKRRAVGGGGERVRWNCSGGDAAEKERRGGREEFGGEFGRSKKMRVIAQKHQFVGEHYHILYTLANDTGFINSSSQKN